MDISELNSSSNGDNGGDNGGDKGKEINNVVTPSVRGVQSQAHLCFSHEYKQIAVFVYEKLSSTDNAYICWVMEESIDINKTSFIKCKCDRNLDTGDVVIGMINSYDNSIPFLFASNINKNGNKEQLFKRAERRLELEVANMSHDHDNTITIDNDSEN